MEKRNIKGWLVAMNINTHIVLYKKNENEETVFFVNTRPELQIKYIPICDQGFYSHRSSLQLTDVFVSQTLLENHMTIFTG